MHLLNHIQQTPKLTQGVLKHHTFILTNILMGYLCCKFNLMKITTVISREERATNTDNTDTAATLLWTG